VYAGFVSGIASLEKASSLLADGLGPSLPSRSSSRSCAETLRSIPGTRTTLSSQPDEVKALNSIWSASPKWIRPWWTAN
jgi:hypothetical protein